MILSFKCVCVLLCVFKRQNAVIRTVFEAHNLVINATDDQSGVNNLQRNEYLGVSQP